MLLFIVNAKRRHFGQVQFQTHQIQNPDILYPLGERAQAGILIPNAKKNRKSISRSREHVTVVCGGVLYPVGRRRPEEA